MQTLVEFMNRDRLKKYKVRVYNYFPETYNELKDIVRQLVSERGLNADLNDIDTSKITDMSYLFFGWGTIKDFDGDISEWDVSNVTKMEAMFYNCKNFTGTCGGKNKNMLNGWDVKNCRIFAAMFEKSGFKGNIEDWIVKQNADMEGMFHACPLESNPPQWYKK